MLKGKFLVDIMQQLPVGVHEHSGHFASFFEDKVRVITNSTVVDHSVYNGRRKIVQFGTVSMNTPI